MRLIAPLLITVALAAGCTSGSDAPPAFRAPADTSFSEGTCRLAAPDVVAIGRQAHDLGDAAAVPPAAGTLLREAQSRLAAVAETAEPAVKTPLDRLVVTVGALRIRSDSGTYDPSLADDVTAAYDAVLSACAPTG